jgi:hypothetical protein
MTHYCAMGNYPKLVLEKAEGHSLTSEMAGARGCALRASCTCTR